jgi:hypothetical protein
MEARVWTLRAKVPRVPRMSKSLVGRCPPSGVPLSGERLFDALFTGVSTQLGLGSVEKCVEKRKSACMPDLLHVGVCQTNMSLMMIAL